MIHHAPRRSRRSILRPLAQRIRERDDGSEQAGHHGPAEDPSGGTGGLREITDANADGGADEHFESD
ncbi:MAG: hypothetical protein KJ042_18905, partial [Deltaproteobacteria bacterium]|nr:hypothetical protein [Deltaproteobacteria bacterium]